MTKLKACIIAVGSEMLTPFRVDTNSLVVTERLNAIGYDVRLKMVVGDDVEELAQVFASALTWADLIVVMGGLGPTDDDVTRAAIAQVLEVPLDLHEHVVDRIRSRFARRGMTMPEINRRQAMAPRGATLIDNPNGTAPGLWIERGSTAIVLLPGPPREMTPMLDTIIRDRLEGPSGGSRLFRRVLRITGRAESDVDTDAQPVYGRWVSAPIPITTTILAVMGQIELHLTATAQNRAEADAALDLAAEELGKVLGAAVYSADGRNLEAVVGDLLRGKRFTIAAAESCTGGLLTSRLTDVPGQFRVRRTQLRVLQQSIEGRTARRNRSAARGARRRQRTGGARDGRRGAHESGHRRWHRHYRDRRSRWWHAGQTGRYRRDCGRRATGKVASGRFDSSEDVNR